MSGKSRPSSNNIKNYFLKLPPPESNFNSDSPADTPSSSQEASCSFSGEASSASSLCTGTGKHRKSGVPIAEWAKSFKWMTLTFNEGNTGMLCSICSRYAVRGTKGSGIWITFPCTRIRRESLTDHEKSHVHLTSLKAAADAEMLFKTGVGKVERSISILNNLKREAFIGALKTMYFLAENELPQTTLYTKLIEHSKRMGCNYLEHLNQAGNAHYTSERIVQELVQVLAAQVRSDVLQEIQSSSYFSILCDETTDISVLNQLIIYIKYVSLTSKEPKVSFLSVCNINNGKAATITDNLLRELNANGLDLSKLVGLGSDGAAVMVGNRNGVAKLLKDETNGLLVNCHCIAHRLALACAQAANEIKYLKKFKDVITQLFYYFQRSSVRMSGLQEMHDLLDSPDIKLKRASDTRWLSHDIAMQSLRRTLVSVVAALERESEERNDCTARGLALFLKTYDFVGSLLMLSDALPVLSMLSKAWQKADVDLNVIKDLVDSTISTMNTLAKEPGIHFAQLKHLLETDWADLKISYSEKSARAFKEGVYNEFFKNIVDNLITRFPDFPLMEAFKVFSPADYKQSQERLKDDMNLLIEHYSANGNPPPIDQDAARMEWQPLSLMMLSSTKYSKLTNREVMIQLAVKPEFQDAFPNMSRLAAIGLSLPVSTAECERGFSAVKRIKTCQRNQMKQHTLNGLLMISLEGCGSDTFDFDAAADSWAAQKKRRIDILSP